MATEIIIKHSNVAGKVPAASNLGVSELAVNLADKKIFTKEPGNTIVSLGEWKDGALVVHWKDKYTDHGSKSGTLVHNLSTQGHTYKLTLTADIRIDINFTLSANECVHWDAIITTGGFTPTFRLGSTPTSLPAKYDISNDATYIISFLGLPGNKSYITGIQEMV